MSYATVQFGNCGLSNRISSPQFIHRANEKEATMEDTIRFIVFFELSVIARLKFNPFFANGH